MMVSRRTVSRRANAPPPPPPEASAAVSDSGPAFARHETFAPRAGWLPKGFSAANSDHAVFLRDDAATQLGVGKNMARSIRYWAHAFGLLEDAPVARARVFASRPTDTGLLLMGPDGRDPFLEDTGSLWYLHWQLVIVSILIRCMSSMY